ncbi:MAG: hypothetical protein FVQ79_10410 [Planctomycetes bacterium]|nr:hypothetical protein [Planctomycetota bacterium]
MLKNDESDHYKHYDSEKPQWTCFAAFGLILSIVSLIILLVFRPEMTSKLMISMFVTQLAAACIIRLTFFARGKHQNQIAIILATVTTLIIVAFVIVLANFYILPIYKDFANF